MSKEEKKPAPRGPVALWQAIQDSAIDDELEEITSMSDKELDGYIAANGGDPAKLRASGSALAKELFERRERLAWQGDMEKKVAAFQATAAAARAAPKEKLSRAQLLARIDVARTDPRFTAPVAALFRQKTAEASTDEELEALLEQIALLAKLEEE
jgi:hypothetical protein